MDKKEFWIRFAIFIAISLIAPLVYIGLRFDLYNAKTTIQLSLWAVVSIILILVIVGAMIKYYISGLKTRYSFLKQLLSGLVKYIFPLVAILVACICFRNNYMIILNNANLLIEALMVIIGCELVGICVNPLPKWAFENNVEGLSEIVDKIFNAKTGDK